jgi:transposase
LSANAACRRFDEQLGIPLDTLGKAGRVDAGAEPGLTTEARLRELEREVRELRRANAIPKTASIEAPAKLLTSATTAMGAAVRKSGRTGR